MFDFSVSYIGGFHGNPILASFDVDKCVDFKSRILFFVCMKDDLLM